MTNHTVSEEYPLIPPEGYLSDLKEWVDKLLDTYGDCEVCRNTLYYYDTDEDDCPEQAYIVVNRPETTKETIAREYNADVSPHTSKLFRLQADLKKLKQYKDLHRFTVSHTLPEQEIRSEMDRLGVTEATVNYSKGLVTLSGIPPEMLEHITWTEAAITEVEESIEAVKQKYNKITKE